MTWTERDQRIIDAWERDDIPAMARELAVIETELAWRPRDEDDADVHPESYRASVLRLYDAWDDIPLWLKILSRILAWRPWR